MLENRMTYSYKNISECIEILKSTDWSTPTRKNNHFSKACELEKLQEKLYELTQCYSFKFADKHSHIGDYRNASYNFKNYTQKELAQKYRLCKNFLVGEIREIKRAMDYGEVNVSDDYLGAN